MKLLWKILAETVPALVFKQRSGWSHVGRILPLAMAAILIHLGSLKGQSIGTSVSKLRVGQLSVNQRTGDQLVGSSAPVLSWQIEDIKGMEGCNITACQLRISDQPLNVAVKNIRKNAEGANKGFEWQTKKMITDHPFSYNYNGPQLKADERYYWQVKIWDESGRESNWSSVDSFHTGLFKPADWKNARWIGAGQMLPGERILPGDTAVKNKLFGTVNDELPLFRKAFTGGEGKKLQKATLYMAGLGQFEASLNGKKIGDHFLDPGWTNYQQEALYVSFDLTDQIRAGENVLGVELGNGFYYIPALKHRYKKLLVQYGYPKMICRLSLTYSDGSHRDIVSDASWKTAVSSISFSSIYGGEDDNGLLHQPGWNISGFKPGKRWNPAVLVSDTPRFLHAQNTDPIRAMETFAPVTVFRSGVALPGPQAGKPEASKPAAHAWVYDMGQNCSGIPAITIEGKKGDTIRLIPAELLTGDSLANQKATGSPYYLQYILGRDGVQSWQPKFTYYGFRYVQLWGAVPAGKPNPRMLPVIKQLKTLHLRGSAPEAGSFACSNELFNKTYELIRWGMKSNMMSVFTDCPHREKLGWLEQVHLMGNSVRYNWQIAHMLKKTIQDMRLSQTPEGLIPEIAPEYTVFNWGGDMFRDSPEWGSSSIILPWYLYLWYGDSSELSKSYEMMTRYVSYLEIRAVSNILYQGLGDWYDLGPQPPGVSQLTPQGLTATAVYYYDLQILDKITGLLNKSDDQQKFRQLAARVKTAFNDKFLHQRVDSTGIRSVYYGAGSQTADAMALYMNLVPDSLHSKVIGHLVREIKNNHYVLTAGDIGYRYLLSVLETEGYSDIIFKMNNRSDVPGYGYQLAKGATALTESWQALPSVSNNHFMLGHLMQWFYEGVLGIKAEEGDVGCRKMIVSPQIVGDLSWARGFYETPFGKLKVDWKKESAGGGLAVTLHIPVGVQAKLELPVTADIKGKSQIMQNEKEAHYVIQQINGKGVAVIAIGAGDYRFVIK